MAEVDGDRGPGLDDRGTRFGVARSEVEPGLERRRGGRDELVFTAPNGGPLRNTNLRSRVFLPAAASIGLAGVTPHDLRHTAASLAVAAGANVKAVQRMLGHASASMTLDAYAGLFGDDLDAVANRLDEAVAARDRTIQGLDGPAAT
ncbi:tyrosine-type recombinase/integrase [Micromonospora coriariae]|uniref:tyrosine-type recombinase/integrase n=1 Tax=Micromonospora coriariae TaxID=285665 RepID=UPI0018D4E8BA|nr:tyrosine-type recombinase/integrase [Micromonospora coriariae]